MVDLRFFVLSALLIAGCQVETGPSAAISSPDTVSTVPERSAPRRATPPRPDTARAVRDTTRAVRQPERLSPEARAQRRAAALVAFQDLADRADDADAQALTRALDLTDERVAALAPEDRAPTLDSLRASARAADRRGDRAGVALAAARGYRALSSGLPDGDPARLRSDGLVLAALARQPLPDWRAIQAASGALGARWGRDARRVEADGVQDALAAAVSGVRTGAEEQNAAVVRLGAEVVVDLAGAGLPSGR